MCLLRIDLSSPARALHATKQLSEQRIRLQFCTEFHAGSSCALFMDLPAQSSLRDSSKHQVFPVAVFYRVCSDMVRLWSWIQAGGLLIKYFIARILGNAKKKDVPLYFLKFLLWIRFRNVKFREQCSARQCSVSGSVLAMSSFPEGWSRQARHLQSRACSGVMITQKSREREEGAAFSSAPHAAGTPRWLRGLQLPQMKAAFIPSCCSVLCAADVFW